MSLLINAVRSLSFTRLGAARSQSLYRFSRRASTESSGTSHSTSTGIPTGGLTVGPWDPNNRIRVVGATLGVIGAGGMLFDTFYRRATKQELNQAMKKLDAKIDREMGKFDAKIDREIGKLGAKIDGLTNGLLQTNQHVDAKIDREMSKLDAKIDGLTKALLQTNQHVDTKIDGLTNALLHTNQRDKIAAETENRELRREIERLKGERGEKTGSV